MKFMSRLRSLEERLGIKTGPAPNLVVHFCDPQMDYDPDDPDGPPPAPMAIADRDSVGASIQGGGRTDKEFERHTGESNEEFERRVRQAIPIAGKPRLIVFWPKSPNPPDQAA